MIALGGTKITKAFLGSTELKNIAIGDELLLSSEPTPLPYDAEIEYLESTGTQCIDTGYTPVIGDSLYCYFLINGTINNTNLQSLYSAGAGSYQFIHLIAKSNSVNGAYFKYFASGAAKYLNYYPSNGNWYALNVSSSGKAVIGNYTSTSTPTNELDGNSKALRLFKRVDDSFPFIGRIGRFYIEHNGIMKLDLIPVRIGQVGYMYDKVSGQLFDNAGTGNFILGNDIT
jgi:hypothetical protein